jgi:hypothetical protein
MSAFDDNQELTPKWLVPVLIGISSTIVSIGFWAGTLQADVEDLKDYKDLISPTIQNNAATLREIAVDLKYIRAQVDRNGSQIEGIDFDFAKYKEETAKSIQNFYRKNPNL